MRQKLSDLDIQRALGGLAGWARRGDALVKTYTFARFGEGIAFVGRVATVADEMDDSRLLPVLAARSRAADELTDRLFPSTVRRGISASNKAGWGAGRVAADLARLDVQHSIAG